MRHKTTFIHSFTLNIFLNFRLKLRFVSVQRRRQRKILSALKTKAVQKNKTKEKVLALDSLNLLHNHTLLSTSTGNFCVNTFLNKPWFLHVCRSSLIESTVRKGEIACNEQFLLFPYCFLLICGNFLPFSSNLKMSSANSFSLEESKICRLEKGNTFFFSPFIEQC